MTDGNDSAAPGAPPARGRGLFGRNLPALLAAGGTTAAVGVAALLVARSMPAVTGTALALLIGLLWTVLAAPVFAAGGSTALDGLVRGGTVVDGGLVLLVALAATGAVLSSLAAVQVYLLWAAVALTECALVLLAVTPAGRYRLAVTAAAGTVALSAGPFWCNALVMSFPLAWRGWLVSVVVTFNPVFATLGCLAEGRAIVWNERPVLYEYTVLGRDVVAHAVPWYATLAAFALLGIGLGCLAAARRRAK